MNTQIFWQDEPDRDQFAVPDDVVDLAFRIRCPTLPVDHAWALSHEITGILPWMESEAQAGLHLIHVADSGNGWERPEAAGDLLYLSRRTRLTLRLPKHRVDDACALSGRTLAVGENRIEVGEPKTRLLTLSPTLYSRYVVSHTEEDEDGFMQRAVAELRKSGLRFKKVLCGKSHDLFHPNGPVTTRSLMVADLGHEDSVRLQQQGLGPMRAMGCGLFIAQKTV